MAYDHQANHRVANRQHRKDAHTDWKTRNAAYDCQKRLPLLVVTL